MMIIYKNVSIIQNKDNNFVQTTSRKKMIILQKSNNKESSEMGKLTQVVKMKFDRDIGLLKNTQSKMILEMQSIISQVKCQWKALSTEWIR